MTFTEVVIVYVSCGAPFAVEQLLSSERSSALLIAMSSTMRLVGWPAFVLAKLLRVIKLIFVSKKNSISGKVSTSTVNDSLECCQTLAILLSGENRGRSYLRAKELLERYTGLASLISRSGDSSAVREPEIALISNHPSPKLAAACLERRNIAVTQKHLAAARDEFLGMIARSANELRRNEAGMLLLADFVGQYDPAAVDSTFMLLEDIRFGLLNSRNFAEVYSTEKSATSSLG